MAGLDGLLFPSRRALEIHQAHGLRHPRRYVLPGLVPARDPLENKAARTASETADRRPYFAAAARLVTEKGIHTLIPLMRHLPEAEMRIAGCGPEGASLRTQAHGLGNVRFLGLLDGMEVHALLRGARAVLVPSLFEETFCLVAAEALAAGTPVVARRRGSLPELIERTSGGLLYEEDGALLAHLRALVRDSALRDRLSRAACSAAPRIWFEEEHTDAYLRIVAGLSRSQGATSRT
jgi:glycosyltransferase involved in cell wall biosynthesis